MGKGITMKILITGGAGFLGRHFTKFLLDRGDKVTIIDDLSTGRPLNEWPENVRSKKGTPLLLDFDLRELLPRLKNVQFDLVIHLAAVVGGREAIEGKPILGAESIELDSLFFRWAVKELPAQVVYLSSSAVYPIFFQNKLNGQNEHLRDLSEDILNMADPYERIGMPDYIYGWAKANGEKLAHTMSEKYGLKVHVARPFSGYGEDQEMVYPMPAICQRVINKENPFIIWGSGDQSRDFIYVDDIVKGIMTRLECKLPDFDVCNYGTGRATTFKELAKLSNILNGNGEVEIKPLPDKPEGVFYRVANTTKLEEFYKPQVTVAQGVDRMLTYLKTK